MSQSPLRSILRRVRELAEHVRITADRVHDQTEEARRLAGVARDQAKRSRELSKLSHQEAHAVHGSLKQSLKAARHNGGSADDHRS